VRSLRSRLFLVWVLSLAASVAVGVLMIQLYVRFSDAALGRAEDVVSRACEAVRDAYRYYDADWNGPAPGQGDAAFRRDLGTVLAMALADLPGLRGGVWQTDQGLLASFPTDASALPATAQWRPVVAFAAEQQRDTTRQDDDPTDPFAIAACPLPGPVGGLVAWTARRVPADAGLAQLRLGLGVLLVLVLAIAGWLTWLVGAWSRHVHRIEMALVSHASEALPRIAPTGERELDRIVAALNTASMRLEAARRESAGLAARMAASERMAALGRVAAGVAHEIRNPIAAMRLRAENALAGDDARRRQALDGILGQISRLDRLLSELLAMTQSRPPTLTEVFLPGFLQDCAREHADAAAAAGVALAVNAPDETIRLDAAMIRRALANLLQNALRETPRGGGVTLAASVTDGHPRISVTDTGPGVAADLRDRLFEPFVTGRADGTGLGLAIARELVAAHGGTLTLAPRESGACFVITLPPADTACPSS
jgi:signal transduction histidine kinase